MKNIRRHHVAGTLALAFAGILGVHRYLTLPPSPDAVAAEIQQVAVSGQAGAMVDSLALSLVAMGATEASGDWSSAEEQARSGIAAAARLRGFGQALVAAGVVRGADADLTRALHVQGRVSVTLAEQASALFTEYDNAYSSGAAPRVEVDVVSLRALIKQAADLHDRVQEFSKNP